jgi:predicted nucleic acid-binding protein
VSRLVVDASVAIKWFVHEVYAEEALRFLDPTHDVTAPDLLWPEFGNILWKKTLRDEVSADMAREILVAFRRVPLRIMPSEPLVEAAFEIANRIGRTVYDSLHLALAAQLGCRLVTADQKLYNAVQTDLISGHLLWIEDHP